MGKKDRNSKDGYRYFVLLLSVLLFSFAILIPLSISIASANLGAALDTDLAEGLTQWNSATEDGSDNISVDTYIGEDTAIEFTVTSDLAHNWLWVWSVNGEEVKRLEGKSTSLSHTFEDFGLYTVSVVGQRQKDGENETAEYEYISASWHVTISLVIGEENDIRDLPGLEDYTIRFSERPERIVSLAPSATEILFAAGAGDSVIGVTVFCNYPLEAKEIDTIGGFSTPSLEKIVALDPDLIVVAHGNPSDVIYRLIELGFEVYGTHAKNIDEILAHIGVVGAIAGCEEGAYSVVDSLRARLEAIEEKVGLIVIEEEQRPRVFYNIGSFFTAGSGTFIDAIIETAGGKNIAVDRSGYFIMSIEKLVDKNPQIIICDSGMGGISGAYEEIVDDERLKIVDAVKNSRVYIIEGDIMSRPGPRVVDAVEIVHEIFSEFFIATAIETETEIETEDGVGDVNEGEATIEVAPAPAPSLEEVVIFFEAIALTSITLKADTNLSNVTVVAERIEEPGNISAPPPSDIVYTYLDIKVKNAAGARIDGKIELRVAKSWLSDNNINVSTVTLWRYNESISVDVGAGGGAVVGWNAFPTYKVSEENASVYFEAVIEIDEFEFSLFAVAGEKEPETAEAMQMPIDAPEPEPEPEPVDVDVAEDVVYGEVQEPEEPELPGFGVVFSLIGLLAGSVIALLRSRRNAFKRR